MRNGQIGLAASDASSPAGEREPRECRMLE